MASRMSLANGEMSDVESFTASEASTAETDPYQDFLNRYTFTYEPVYGVKLRKSVGSLSLRANLYLNRYYRSYGELRPDPWTFVVKPADEDRHKWLHKLAVEPAVSMLKLSTAKFKLWDILRLQFTALYDWEFHRPSLTWNVTSKWSRGQKMGRKERLRSKWLPSAELRPHWHVDLFMPEVEGRLGMANGGEAIHVEQGHCRIQIPKMELILSLNHIGSDVRSLMHRALHRDAYVDSYGAGLKDCSAAAPALEAEAPAAQLLAASGADEVAAATLHHNWWARQRQDYQESALRSRQCAPRSRPAGVWIYPPAQQPRQQQIDSSSPVPWKPLVDHVGGAVDRLKAQLHCRKQGSLRKTL